ncbi:MAG: 30S ribosomal protein S8 [Actinobacteria bacterium]|nr:30S ribosomal protein S8 [Actinomycetota bacterium]MBL7123766.1 30S ribosomal protein S8 [Actinomycetota bacterium]
MSVTDPIADMLTRIRNAINVKMDSVKIPSSKMKVEIARILHEEGFIGSYEVIKEESINDIIEIRLKYDSEKTPMITGLKRVSKPGLRVYAERKNMPQVLGGFGSAILSTSKGVLTGEKAKKLGVGGEVICYVW